MPLPNGYPNPLVDEDVLLWAVEYYPTLMVAFAQILIACDLRDNMESLALHMQTFIAMQEANILMDNDIV